MPTEHVHVEVLAAGPQKHISELHRFALLVIGSFECICCSFSYAFNLISGAMQERYNLSQRDLSIITTVGLVFQYTMLPYAFLYDYIGPIPISILATVFFTVGSVLLALCFLGVIEGGLIRLCVYNAFLMCSCCLYDLLACITVPTHFPTRKGPVAAMLKCFTGLGQAIVGALYAGFFSSTHQYYFFLMAFSFVVGLLSIAFMRNPSYHLTEYEQHHLDLEERKVRLNTKSQYLKQDPPAVCFKYGFAIVIFLIIYLLVEGLLVNYLSLGKTAKIAFAIITAVATIAFIAIAFPIAFVKEQQYNKECAVFDNNNQCIMDEDVLRIEQHKPGKSVKPLMEPINDNPTVAENNIIDTNIDNSNISNNNSNNKTAIPETDIDYIAPQYPESFLQSAFTLDLWALWWTFFCLLGTEMVVIFNATYILGAVAGEPPSNSMRSLLTTVNGTGSALGRLLMALFETWSQARTVEERIPITVTLFAPAITVSLATVFFLTLPASVLPLPYIIAALNNGFLNACIMLITRTVYSQDPVKYYNFCFLAIALSSIALNRFVYGEWYSKQAEKQNNADKQCYGRQCITVSMCILLGLCASTVVTSTFFHLRYRKFCQLMLKERRRIREEAANEAEEKQFHELYDTQGNTECKYKGRE